MTFVIGDVVKVVMEMMIFFFQEREAAFTLVTSTGTVVHTFTIQGTDNNCQHRDEWVTEILKVSQKLKKKIEVIESHNQKKAELTHRMVELAALQSTRKLNEINLKSPTSSRQKHVEERRSQHIWNFSQQRSDVSLEILDDVHLEDDFFRVRIRFKKKNFASERDWIGMYEVNKPNHPPPIIHGRIYKTGPGKKEQEILWSTKNAKPKLGVLYNLRYFRDKRWTVDGAIVCSKPFIVNPGKKSVTYAMELNVGKTLGEIGILLNSVWPYDLVCSTRCRLFMMSNAKFLDILEVLEGQCKTHQVPKIVYNEMLKKFSYFKEMRLIEADEFTENKEFVDMATVKRNLEKRKQHLNTNQFEEEQFNNTCTNSQCPQHSQTTQMTPTNLRTGTPHNIRTDLPPQLTRRTSKLIQYDQRKALPRGPSFTRKSSAVMTTGSTGISIAAPILESMKLTQSKVDHSFGMETRRMNVVSSPNSAASSSAILRRLDNLALQFESLSNEVAQHKQEL